MTDRTQGPKAKAICDKWAAKLGYGFHPETRGPDYRPPLSAAEAQEYEDDMMRLFGLDILDPYLYALAALKEWEMRQ